VTLKWAQSLNGIIGSEGKGMLKISGKEALIESHQNRIQYDAILCGASTVMSDNPSLRAAYQGKAFGKNPIRIILDSKLKTTKGPLHDVYKNGGKAIIFCDKRTNKILTPATTTEIRVIPVPLKKNRLELEVVLEELGRQNISHLLVEGGARILQSFVSQNLVDQYICYLSPQYIEIEKPVSLSLKPGKKKEALLFYPVECRPIGKDIKIVGYPNTF
jgi:diaminohydroxyphosphoribosylaminopyrimidine deaminase / 5-amino-6-(5-phosphoribosylamino)uracil reductase